MRIRCRHGYFMFEELRPGQISDFMQYSNFEAELVSVDDYYTFDLLKDAPRFSLPGLELLGTPAIAMFEGEPWKVFEANEMVYDFTKDLIAPISSVTRLVTVAQIGNAFISPGLILPGSLTTAGKRVKDYSAWFSRDTLSWQYTEIGYV